MIFYSICPFIAEGLAKLNMGIVKEILDLFGSLIAGILASGAGKIINPNIAE